MFISVVGCGWLGMPLAKELITHGHQIAGSTRNELKLLELKEYGITSFLYNEEESIDDSIVRKTDILIITVPPGKTKDYSQFIRELIYQFPVTTKIIYTSSIGIYIDKPEFLDENSLIDQQHPVSKAEDIIKEFTPNHLILRLAGLIGEDRHPVFHMRGTEVKNPNYPVNLVQQADAINSIVELINEDCFGHIFNICYPYHPSKKEYYSEIALLFSEPQLNFENNLDTGKSIDGSLIEKTTNFKYAFRPDLIFIPSRKILE